MAAANNMAVQSENETSPGEASMPALSNTTLRTALLALVFGLLLLALLDWIDNWSGQVYNEPKVHLALISLSILFTLGLGVVAMRIFFVGGTVRSFSLGVAFLLFAATYVWHGIFTQAGHPFAFLIYGPTSRLMFGLALFGFVSTSVAQSERRFPMIVMAAAAAAIIGFLAFLSHTPLNAWAINADPARFYPTRVTVEVLALSAVAISVGRLLWADVKRGEVISKPIIIALVLIFVQSIFFIATGAWTVTWWAAHALGAASTFLLTAAVTIDFQKAERLSAKKKYDEIADMKNNFINTAAHELGTPMTPVMLQLHVLQSDKSSLSEAQLKSVKIIENNLQRLDVLIKRVLDGSRTLTGNLEFDVREFDLAAALTELHDTYNALAEEKGLNCSFEGPNKLMMKSDKLRIQQIVSNAMDNALKYTPSGGQVNCTFSYTPEQAIIQITDSGDGISEEMMNQLFRPFSRVHGTETSQPGSGLGLFLSKEIAEALGGSMSASSKGRGKGTKIIVELPLIAKNRQKANEA